MSRHLISAADLTREEAVLILDTTAELASVADRPIRKLPTLRGRTVVNLFYEDSTRTRTSFEAGVVEMGGHPMVLRADELQLSRGESVRDLARGPVLGVGRLRVRVQVTAEVSELRLVPGQEHVQVRKEVIPHAHHPRAGRICPPRTR